VVGPQLRLSTFARSKRGTTVLKSTYTDMILLDFSFEFSGFYYTSNFLRVLRIVLHFKQLSYKPLDTNDRKTRPFGEILS